MELNTQTPKIQQNDPTSWPWKRPAPVKLGSAVGQNGSNAADTQQPQQDVFGDSSNILTERPQDRQFSQENLLGASSGGETVGLPEKEGLLPAAPASGGAGNQSSDPIFRGGFGELGNNGSRS